MRILTVFLLYIACLILVLLIANETLPLGKSLAITMTWFNEAKLGVIHWPSVVYIFGTFVFLHIFRKRSVAKENLKKAKKSLKEDQAKLAELSQAIDTDNKSIETYQKLLEDRSPDHLYGRLVTLLTRGCSEKDIRFKLGIEFGNVIKSSHELIRQKGLMAGLMPLLGMIGTITGLMFIFAADQTLGGNVEDNFNHKFAGMGTALLTTLYATLLTAMWFKPRQAALVDDLSSFQKDVELLGHQCELIRNQLDLNLLHHCVMTEYTSANQATVVEEPQSTTEDQSTLEEA